MPWDLIIPATFRSSPEAPEQSCKLTMKRKMQGEWLYLATFTSGSQQWIPAERFVKIDGDTRRLARYPD